MSFITEYIFDTNHHAMQASGWKTFFPLRVEFGGFLQRLFFIHFDKSVEVTGGPDTVEVMPHRLQATGSSFLQLSMVLRNRRKRGQRSWFRWRNRDAGLFFYGGFYIVAAFLYFPLDIAFRIIEFTHAFSQSPHQFRNFPSPEQQQHDHQDDDDLIGAQHTQ